MKTEEINSYKHKLTVATDVLFDLGNEEIDEDLFKEVSNIYYGLSKLIEKL